MAFSRRAKLGLLALTLLAAAAAAVLRMLPPKAAVSMFDKWQPSAAGKVWTITGFARSPRVAFVDTSGSFQPGQGRYSVRYYLYDRDSGLLLYPNPSGTRRHLVSGHLPAPCVKWQEGGITVNITTFATERSGFQVCFSEVKVKNDSSRTRKLSLFAAVLPYEITGTLHGPSSVGYDRQHRAVLVNDAVFLSCDLPPDSFGAVASDIRLGRKLVDVTSYIAHGNLPPAETAPAARTGVTSGAVQYDIEIRPREQRTLSFRSPLSAVTAGDFARQPCAGITLAQARRRFVDHWSGQLAAVKLSLPDKRYSDCFYASLAYLIVLNNGGLPRPGPSKYEAFWIRDFAYIADALYFAGRSDLILPGLNKVRELQLPNGGFRPTTFSGGDDEYDAPGQAIYALVRHYARTGDGQWLAEVWPAIHSAAGYIKSKRLSNASEDEAKRGILPPSRSAEDLGSPRLQHYWDDFWCIRGLVDAAFAAAALGRDRDAAWMRREADTLRAATWSSVRAVAKKHGISYIPNGPEEVASSAMARGTSCAIWPCDVLDTSDPFVRSSFDAYWKKWIGPHGGGFEHKGDFWPYGGLDLANCYLMLDRFKEAATILRWTMDHDPTGGFYSYPEGMDKKTLALAAGDMPHGWFCASYISLLRNLLVRERGDEVLLFSGVPAEWLQPGKQISIGGFPTLHGKVTYRLRSSSDSLKLSITPGANPPGSYRVILPESMRATALIVDGAKQNEPSLQSPTREVVIHPSAHEVTIRITRS